MAVFSRLLPTVITGYAVQSLAALIFVPQQQDKFYDFTGALGFLSSAVVSLYYPALKAKFVDGVPGALPGLSTFAPRQLLLSYALVIWATRLGTFLLNRSLLHGGDSRFDEIKKNPKRFTYYWLAQGTWTLLVGLPVYLANTLPSRVHTPLGPRDYISFAIFASSFTLEVLADAQKSKWRAKKMRGDHHEKFIKSGLWSISRHPNYVAEVGVWTGIWALSTTALQNSPYPVLGPAVAAISPLFTWFLLTKASGVPPLERAGDKKFGDDPDYKTYKKNVPVFWPWGTTNWP
ncbi:DUF1295-domain-containing protein [Ramaria rubella]|nr:DUF1295-domain-containing protein [Ramaria rubella]